MKVTLKSAVLGLGLLLCGALPAMADDDSSSDAAGGFARQVGVAEGVLIKVPLNEAGEELTSAAEMRLHLGDSVTSSSDLQAVFNAAVDAGQAPEVTQSDIDRDSSTNGWNRYHGNGWQQNYYYNYNPYYYNQGYYYRFNVYSYRNYNYYYPNGGYNYGYRYYYYNNCR